MNTFSNESIIGNRKYYKRNKVLNLIRTNGRCSRYDIKKQTSYGIATVLAMVDELIADGFVYEQDSTDSKVGRKPVWLRLNPQYGCFIGIEFHSTRINCAMLDFCGHTVHQAHEPIGPEEGAEEVLSKIVALIRSAIETVAPNGRVLGIGVGVAGYFDAESGISIEYAPIRGWKDIPIKQYIEDAFHCTCYIENNVAAMAMGYKYLIMPKDSTEDFVFVSIRSGVRLVPVIQNELFLSNKGYAGQLGHVKVNDGNRLCLCGKRGCLNTEVADSGLRSKLIEAVLAKKMQRFFGMAGHDLNRIDTRLFVDAALAGDPESIELMRETAGYMGQSLGIMLDILAPTHVVLYGELCRAGDLFLQPLKAALALNAMPDNTANLSVTLCTMDESMGAYGAASLVMQKQFEFLKEIV